MKYVVFFRGINVGGKNIVKMNDLKQLLFDLGLSKVKTYIQSGNAVFESMFEESYLQEAIYNGFADHFGFASDVMIRSMQEIEALINHLPFSREEIEAAQDADPKVEHLYIYFLKQQPEQIKIDTIIEEYGGPDTFQLIENEVYFLCYQSISRSKLAMRMTKVFGSATVRNWKTVNKLYDMLKTL